MENALRLPVAVQGALMPDAHQGYGLPIGGVLATEDTVIPYAVGVDIACRMKLSVLDLPSATAGRAAGDRSSARCSARRSSARADAARARRHDVLDAGRWSLTQLVRGLREQGRRRSSARAARATTSSSSARSTSRADDLGLEAGAYLALLSHSGSRGTGAQIASHYTKIARALHPELPEELVVPRVARPRLASRARNTGRR